MALERCFRGTAEPFELEPHQPAFGEVVGIGAVAGGVGIVTSSGPIWIAQPAGVFVPATAQLRGLPASIPASASRTAWPSWRAHLAPGPLL